MSTSIIKERKKRGPKPQPPKPIVVPSSIRAWATYILTQKLQIVDVTPANTTTYHYGTFSIELIAPPNVTVPKMQDVQEATGIDILSWSTQVAGKKGIRIFVTLGKKPEVFK